MVMTYTMKKSIKECVPKTENAKEFLQSVKSNYTKIDKSKIATYLKLLTNTSYDGISGVREHIIKMKHYWNKANDLKVGLTDTYLKFTILQSLPSDFSPVMVAYNASLVDWSLGI